MASERERPKFVSYDPDIHLRRITDNGDYSTIYPSNRAFVINHFPDIHQYNEYNGVQSFWLQNIGQTQNTQRLNEDSPEGQRTQRLLQQALDGYNAANPDAMLDDLPEHIYISSHMPNQYYYNIDALIINEALLQMPEEVVVAVLQHELAHSAQVKYEGAQNLMYDPVHHLSMMSLPSEIDISTINSEQISLDSPSARQEIKRSIRQLARNYPEISADIIDNMMSEIDDIMAAAKDYEEKMHIRRETGADAAAIRASGSEAYAAALATSVARTHGNLDISDAEHGGNIAERIAAAGCEISENPDRFAAIEPDEITCGPTPELPSTIAERSEPSR